MTKESSTTRDNYEERMRGPSGLTSNEAESGSGWSLSEKLSNLFIDIGTLALSLGIRYVWIDSICIIQDDNSDWESEAKMMSAYYQHAWLTVAATKTVAAGGGFLRQTPLDVRSIPRVSRLPYRNRQGRREGYFYLQGLPESTLRQEYEEGIINSDLLNRGWVFQEWILSPRILCFSKLVPFLVCAELPPLPIAGNIMTNNEIDSARAQRDITILNDPFWYGEIGLFEHGYRHHLGLDLTTSRKAVFETWKKLMTIYSGLELTRFEKDRLVALAGIAEEIGLALSSIPASASGPGGNQTDMQAKYSNAYACGIWLGDIVQELQWERSDGLKKPPCRVRGFPSWSWMSCGSPITNDEGLPTLGGARVLWPKLETFSNTDGFWASRKRKLADPVWRVSLNSAYSIPTSTQSDGRPTNLSQSNEWKMLDPLKNDYGNSNRFVRLSFQQAKFIAVKVGPHFSSQKDSYIAAKCTNYESNGQRDHWRAVTLPRSEGRGVEFQEVIRGWASLEHPDYQRPGRDPKEDHVLALRMAHIPEVHSMGGRFISFSDTAEIVLYIRQVAQGETGDRTYFERLGVGRLFGSETESEFAAAEEGEIWLV